MITEHTLMLIENSSSELLYVKFLKYFGLVYSFVDGNLGIALNMALIGPIVFAYIHIIHKYSYCLFDS